MKKLLSIVGTISLITSGSSNLIACNSNTLKTLNTLTPEELAKLKEQHSKNIKGNKLEWIAPQEKPFSIVESKYYMRWYIIIWRGNINDNWRIVKFKHNEFKKDKIIDKYNEYKLELKEEADYPFNSTLYVKYSSSRVPVDWESDNGTYFKAVYRWDNNSEPIILIIDPKIGEILD